VVDTDERCFRRATSVSRRLLGSEIKPAAVESHWQMTAAGTGVAGGSRAAGEFLHAALTGRRRLSGPRKRRFTRNTGTATVDGPPAKGTDLLAATCGRRRDIKVKNILPASMVVVASLLVVSHHQGGTGCRMAGIVPNSPAALGRFQRVGGRWAVKKFMKLAAKRHAATTGGRRAEYSRWPATAGRAAATDGRQLLAQFRTPAAVVDIGRPRVTVQESSLFFSGRHQVGRRRRVVGNRGMWLGTRPAATDTRRRLSFARRYPAAADNRLPAVTVLSQADKRRQLPSASRRPVPPGHRLPAARRLAQTDKRHQLTTARRRPVAADHRLPASPRPAPTNKRRRLIDSRRLRATAYLRGPCAPQRTSAAVFRPLFAGRWRRTTVYRRRGPSPRLTSAAG